MFDEREFRDALGCFATGVTILTAGDQPETACAMTINAFSAVSLDPPLVLTCIKNMSHTLNVADEFGKFAVHIVSSEQKETALACASNSELHRPNVDLVMSENSIPVLNDYLARFECTVENTYKAGDHRILMGRVIDFSKAPQHVMPLTFFRGQLGTFEHNAH